MKNYLILLFLFVIGNATAQNIYIPDTNFKAALVGDSIINTNGDGEIQTTEASLFSGGINVSNKMISDLTGIEAFTMITFLDCSNNNLTSLNVTANTALTSLFCNNNYLTSLNVTAISYSIILYIIS